MPLRRLSITSWPYHSAGVKYLHRHSLWIGLRFHHDWGHGGDENCFGDPLRSMARDVPRNFAATCGVTHDRRVLEIEDLDHSLKQAGGADVILVTSNSYKAASESLKGLRPDGRMVL